MKKLFFLILFVIAGLNSGNLFAQPVDSTTLNAANITGTVNLSNSTTYILKGFTVVRNGGVLVIQQGTLIKGDKPTTGTIIVERGGKIIADGTANQPIVFTSRQPAGQRAPGDWGGIVILGRAGINTAAGADSAKIEGFPSGTDFWYGGQPMNDSDSSGVLRYVRLEYPGVNLTGTSGNEINGLTMGGVGSRTVVQYVQVSYSGDDAYEFFGGTVNARYLIAIGTVDDDFDCDNGHRGKIQFGLSVKDSNFSDVSASHHFEIDNNANSPANFNNPRTQTVFSNITCIGPNTGTHINFIRGAHLRRNMLAKIYNTVFTSYVRGIRFDGSGVYASAQADSIQVRNILMAGVTRIADTAGTTSFSPTTWLQTPAWGSRFLANTSDAQLTSPFGFYLTLNSGPAPLSGVPYWTPLPTSPALSGADFSSPYLSGMDVTTYVGAFGSANNWTAGWSNFNPQGYNPQPVGIQQVSSNVPGKYSLSQNYPNPFNPSTKIQFALPKAGFVTLKVYNVAGKEVASLVNGKLNTGEFEYTFNAANLNSGVYFYTLKTEGFVETKKMLLIK